MSTATPDIAAIVRQVLAEITASGAARPAAIPSAPASGSFAGANGVFGSVDEAVRGVIVRSGRPGSFFAGADLARLEELGARVQPAAAFRDSLREAMRDAPRPAVERAVTCHVEQTLLAARSASGAAER